ASEPLVPPAPTRSPLRADLPSPARGGGLGRGPAPVPTMERGPERLAPTIEFDNVHFAYPGGRRAAHDGLSFAVGAGDKIGIVGPSGSGKSWVALLLLRVFDPQGGT